MCGILAALLPGGGRENALGHRRLDQALASLSHRGPDNVGRHVEPGVFLGHTRLSILDTSADAHQPFCFEHLVLTYNGEVFNYVELRQTLMADGYEFSTGSDTEVVIKAFHRYGSDCFSMFNGMWALAIYDTRKQELTVCRDRFGQKPLYIARVPAGLVVASELQALSQLLDTCPNFAAIGSFLKEGDFDVKGNTFFQDIFEFPKSCFVRIGMNLQCSTERYWDYPNDGNSDSVSTSAFHDLLTDAVKLRLRTDVDYSLLLSGGLDSTVIAGITRTVSGKDARLAAFTYSSSDLDDELPFARQVTTALGIDLHVQTPERGPTDYIRRLRRLVRHMGRGHSSPAIMSVDYLYQNVRQQGYKVALDGQGADELLAGYKHYHFHLLADLIRQGQWRQIPPLLRDLHGEGLRGVLIMALRNSLPDVFRKLARTLYGYERLLSSRPPVALQKHPWAPASSMQTSGNTCLNAYLIKQHDVGLANLLYYGDIVAMGNSVENRSPFMDHRIVEAAFRTGFQLKVDMGQSKAVLRKHPVYAAFGTLLDRPKIGFSSAIGESIKREMIKELLNSSILDWPIINRNAMMSFLQDNRAMDIKFERFLFRLFQLHLWEQEFIGAVSSQSRLSVPAASEVLRSGYSNVRH